MAYRKHIRVSYDDLWDRLDTGYYSPEYFDARDKLVASGIQAVPVGSVCEPWGFGAYALCNDIEWSDAEHGIPYIKSEALGSPMLNYDGLSFITRSTHELLIKSQVKAGDIIVSTSATIGPCAVLPASIPQANTNQDTIKFRPPSTEFDNYFAATWMASLYGQTFLTREAGGAVQQHVYLSNFKQILLVKPDFDAQVYIGNKVRQAERLREHARELETAVVAFHTNFIPTQDGLDYRQRSRRITSEKIADRIDAHHYPPVVEQYFKLVQREPVPLHMICDVVFSGHTMPETNEVTGVLQVTVANLGSLFLKGTPRWVTRPTTRNKYLKEHDLLVCNAAHSKDFIGRDVTYFHGGISSLPSTEVMVIRVDRGKVPASYIRTYLLTKIGYLQIQSTIRGISAHAYPDDMKRLDIPIPNMPEAEKEGWLATDKQMSFAGMLTNYSDLLAISAQFLVEALIDGKVSENELKAAQEALECGDASLDRAILQRMTCEGMDVVGEPALFPDLDALYATLAEVASAEPAVAGAAG